MKLIIVIFCFSLLPFSASAQDAFYLSGLLGLSQAEFDNGTASSQLDTELTYGVRGGLLFNDNVSAGVFIQQYDAEQSTSVLNIPITTEYSMTNIMAEVSYYFNVADENSFWISGLLGITRLGVDALGASDNDSETALGATLGYHFVVAPNFSLSPQFTYIYTDTSSGSVTQISGLVNLTVWL